MSEEMIRARSEAGPPAKCPFRLSQFLASPAIVVQGERLARRDVIKYVRNKLGGTHFDDKRENGEEAYAMLDSVTKGKFEVLEKRAVYFELLSIGQAVAASPDTKTLRGLIG
jgi:hypothetical protein